MATTPDKTKFQADLFEWTIAGSAAPYLASVELPAFLTTVGIAPKQTGDVIASIVTQRTFDFNIVIYQGAKDELLEFLNIADTAPRDAPAVGSLLPQHAVNFHNPQAADTSGDLYLYAATFHGIEPIEQDGVRGWRIRCRAEADASGDVFRVGPATDP